MVVVVSLRLLPFQRRFVRAVESDKYLTCALSGPRGLGKTTLAGWLCARALTPGDCLYAGALKEVVLFSGSIEQCRLVFRAAIDFLGDRIDDYRLVDSATRVGITHKASRTRLKAIGSEPEDEPWFGSTSRWWCWTSRPRCTRSAVRPYGTPS